MWLWTRGEHSLLRASLKRGRWGAYARFIYVLLLATVFPFICWGQGGQADHPHPRSHFVFIAPPEFQPFVIQSNAGYAPHSQHVASASATPPLEDITGQSTPTTLAIFTLSLVFALSLWLIFRPVSQKHLFTLALGTAQQAPVPLGPPPRSV